MRSQAAGWPSLDDEPLAPSSPDAETELTVDQIRDMLDRLDIRLANGGISESTYQQLYARWEARLQELDD